MNALDTPVENLPGVGSQTKLKLSAIGIDTVGDLLYYLPYRYDDFSKITSIGTASLGPITVRAYVKRVSARYSKKGVHISEVVLSDGTGELKAVWFHAPYIKEQLLRETEYYFSGSVDRVGSGFALVHPGFERCAVFTKHTARIVPVYRQTKDISSSMIRRLMVPAMSYVKRAIDILPLSVVAANKLMPRSKALRYVHFPSIMDDAVRARARLAFEELFVLMLAEQSLKGEIDKLSAPTIKFDQSLAKKFVKSLPFELTSDQRRVAWEILQDISCDHPSNRLVQGDVGSGKTVVAAMAAAMTINTGYQVALMAPTEVLAQQHTSTLRALLRPLGMDDCVYLLTGSLKASAKQELYHKVMTDQLMIVVGTHALIQKKVHFSSLGLIIVDEQHRFGVRQRRKLLGKSLSTGGRVALPHLLSMTATPIPRSLALTLYSDLDISSIHTMPAGRCDVLTQVVAPRNRDEMYKKTDRMIAKGQQVYVVCPLVEDSDVLGVKSVTTEYARLQQTVFAHRRVGLLHGKLKPAEKEKILGQFVSGRLDILVSTTVVEVGVDVPNATVLIIEGAERFGLSQLHQLRGRVGRSDQQSYCYLIATGATESYARLRYLTSINDGFEISELDLRLRGPGEIRGVRQHGDLDLKIADFSDVATIKVVQSDVKNFLANDNISSHHQLRVAVDRRLARAHLN